MKYSLLGTAGFIVAIATSAVGQDRVNPTTTAGSSSVSASSVVAPGFLERNPRYQLRKGDTFDVDFALSSEFNQTVAVQPDGYVTLKAVGTIFVEGQTVPELTESLKAAYAKILRDPMIAIALKDFEKPYFIAAGQVAKPGKYELRSELTVTQAVAIAGGFNDKAKRSKVVLFRPVAGNMFETKVLDIKKLLASSNLSEDVRLRPGDMLYVPQSSFSKIRPFLPTTAVGAYYNPVLY